MKRFSEQFNKKAGSVKLRAAERRELKDRLVSYIEYHPLPTEMKKEAAPTKVADMVSEPFVAVKINFSYLKAALGTMAVLAIVVVPFVAENSLPGDVLYPVKVQFNEELRSSLSLSSYAKVEWETERLERRVAEARLLASEGKLTEEVEAEVAEAIKTHSDAAQQQIASLRESDEDEAAMAEIAFASALAVQSEVLDGDAPDNAEEVGEGTSVAILASVVAEESEEADAKQATADPAYEKLLARVETETTRAQELFVSISDVASADEQTDIERRLADIETKVNAAISIHAAVVTESPEGEDKTEVATDVVSEEVSEEATVASSTEAEASTTEEVVEEEVTEGTTEEEEVPVLADDSEARSLLRSALSDTRKLISFMTNIDVRENVTIEELVPVTLTDDEHIALINGLLLEIESGRENLGERIVSAEAAEKFAIGLTRLDELTAEATELRANAAYQEAYDAAREAALVYEELLNRSQAPMVEVVEEESETEATSTPETEEESETETEPIVEEELATTSEAVVE